MTEQYVGEEVQIGGGFGGMKPLAQHGRVIIADGVLTLYGSNGEVIAAGALTHVQVKKRKIVMGQGVDVTIDGARYFISVGHGRHQFGPLSAPRAQAAESRAGTKGFVAAYEAITGRAV